MLPHVIALLTDLIAEILRAARDHWSLQLLAFWVLPRHLCVCHSYLITIFYLLLFAIDSGNIGPHHRRVGAASHRLLILGQLGSTDEFVLKQIWLNVADFMIVFGRIGRHVIRCLVRLLQVSSCILVHGRLVRGFKLIVLLIMRAENFAGGVIAINVGLILQPHHRTLLSNVCLRYLERWSGADDLLRQSWRQIVVHFGVIKQCLLLLIPAKAVWLLILLVLYETMLLAALYSQHVSTGLNLSSNVPAPDHQGLLRLALSGSLLNWLNHGRSMISIRWFLRIVRLLTVLHILMRNL